MKINDKFYIAGTHDGDIVTNLLSGKKCTVKMSDASYEMLSNVLKIVRKRSLSTSNKNKQLAPIYKSYFSDEDADARFMTLDPSEIVYADHDTLKRFADDLLAFFSEFKVNISIRFVDTFIRSKDKLAYTRSYFQLSDSPWFNEISDKIKSTEFAALIDRANAIYLRPEKQINKHLKVYYGPAGTGKTTKACAEAQYCIPCSSDMDCKELLKDFTFDDDGKPAFKKSVFRLAIENGYTVVLDEINLLNTQVRQFLQSLTDGKEYVDFEGTKIKIHPEFMAIGTMNLIVNGMTFALSEPLVDRCSEIKCYDLTGDNIAKALLA